jgi:hypothetical protein
VSEFQNRIAEDRIAITTEHSDLVPAVKNAFPPS